MLIYHRNDEISKRNAGNDEPEPFNQKAKSSNHVQVKGMLIFFSDQWETNCFCADISIWKIYNIYCDPSPSVYYAVLKIFSIRMYFGGSPLQHVIHSKPKCILNLKL